MLDPDERGFWWVSLGFESKGCVVKCKATKTQAAWNVVRVTFDAVPNIDLLQQTMDTLLDVCRMRYADELLNQGETK